jgi:hypothetical protein
MKYFIVLAILALGSFGTAEAANVISGNLWHVSNATSQNAVPANVPGTPPDVTFDVNSPFNFDKSDATVAAWLATSAAFNIVQNTAGTLASQLSNGTISSLIDFKGVVSVIHNQTFTVTHDDGLTLNIGGLNVINVPGPTSPVKTTVTYTGPTGNFAFELVYGECCAGPAVLQIDLPLQKVPEPGSALLLATGLAGFLGYGWRRRQRVA